AKYVERILTVGARQQGDAAQDAGLTLEKLADLGYK
ncbi:MAG: hypothetical protein QOG00_709, partial [Pyrinomonadaceae bacterium]|nr:hypothetical protein [Pyrinomonadaceae bacterium]